MKIAQRILLRSLWIAALLCFGHKAFAQAPTITSVSPMTGPEKRNVTILGSNYLSASITSRTVRLNGQSVGGLSVSAGRLGFTVPAGATSGPISITTNLGTVSTTENFIVGAGAPPPNDNFANALPLPSDLSGATIGNTANATKELNEPSHAGLPSGASVWFSWTAPTSGRFIFNPHDSAVTTNFGVNLAVYTGSSLEALTPVASGFSGIAFSRFQSSAAFDAIGGVTYMIAMDGFNGIMGDYRLAWSPLSSLSIASFTPTSGYSGQTLTITGTGFVSGSQVIIGGVTAASNRVTINSTTSITVTQIPFNAVVGSSPITVVTSLGTVTSTSNFTVIAPPPPTITSFTPTTGPSSTQITISGSALTLGDGSPVTVRFNGVASTAVTLTSATSITARVPSGATTGPISVETAAGVATSSTNFQVPGSVVAPVILGFSPPFGLVGSSVFISGQNFAGTANVSFNGLSTAFSVDASGGSITALVPLGASTGYITVSNAAGTATSAFPFFVMPPPPTISGFTPAAITDGASVVISGTDFTNVQSVSFNGVSAASFVIDSTSQITAVVPVGPIPNGSITVTTASGTATSANFFSYTPPPTITGFSPPNLTDGTVVVISGTALSNASSVLFNGASAASFTVDSSTQITAVVPVGPLNSGPITVTTPGGTAASTGFFVYSPPFTTPIITGFSPSVVAPGLPVVITGINLNGVQSVRFNGANASFVFNSSTQLTATAPSTLTPGFITVTTVFGTAVSQTIYTVTQLPIITTIDPPSGPEKRVIRVTGANFSGTGISGLQVRMNGTLVSSLSTSANALSFPVPVGATTGPITIQTNQGITSSPSIFTVTTGPAPANDHFANAQVISGVSGFVTGNTANATKEPGEPNHAGNPGGASVWFTWTAPQSGLFLISPSQPLAPAAHFGYIETIYTGTDVTSLTPVASGLTPTGIFARFGSAAVLNAIAGTSYHIALDGYNGVMADYRLSWAPLGPPTVGTFTPSSGAAGQILTSSMTINGTNFSPGATVSFGGGLVDPARITYQSTALITVTQIPINAVTGPITITTPAGSATSAGIFTVGPPPPPVITFFGPSGAKTGTVVTLTGTNFTGTTAVRFNGVAVTAFTVNSATQITTTIPAGATTGFITVTTPGGTATSVTEFTVITPPVIVTQPISQTVTIGQPVSFSVTATSNGPVEYSWHKIGGSLAGNPTAFNSTLVIPSATLADAGSYYCQVGNNAAILETAPATLTVNKIPVTITLSNLVATYDGSPKAVTVTTSPANVPVQVIYHGVVGTPSHAGNYMVAAIVDDATYTGAASATLVIHKATASVALANLTATYDGAPHAASATTVPAGLTVNLTYNGTATAPTNAGSYAVVATVNDANYAGSTQGGLFIAPAVVSFTLSNLAQTYDGTPKSPTVTTAPVGVSIAMTYNGAPSTPTAAGSYPFEVNVTNPNYTGATAGTLVIAQGTATLALGDLVQPYDGQPHSVTTTTTPAGLAVSVTYNGSTVAPTNPGTYAVIATLNDANFTGTISDTLTITIPVLVRHAPTLNGGLDGSLQVLLGESLTLNGNAYISGDLLMPGTPIVRLNGHPAFVGTRDGTGSVSPANYEVTLNGNAVLRYLVRRTDAIALPTVLTPPLPTGTRDVSINSAGQTPGDFATIRHLTLNSNAGSLAVPAGTYGTLTANGNSRFILGVAGATAPAIYHLQRLTLNGSNPLEVVGPVVINLANGTSINGNVGASGHPEWITLNVASGSVTLNSNVTFHGSIVAPNGTVTINGNSTLNGSVASDRLTINGNGLLDGVR